MGVAGFCVVSVIKDFNGKLEGAATEPYNRCADNRLMMKYNNQLKKMPKIMSLNVRSFYGSLQGTINAPITG